MTWLLTRSAGVGAYLMLFLSVAWGLLATTSLVDEAGVETIIDGVPRLRRQRRTSAPRLPPRRAAFDRFVPLRPLDLLIPYRAAYHPFRSDPGDRRDVRDGHRPDDVLDTEA